MSTNLNENIMGLVNEAFVTVMSSNDEVSHWARKGLLGEVVTAKEYMKCSKESYLESSKEHESDIKLCDKHIAELDNFTHELSDKIARHTMGVL